VKLFRRGRSVSSEQSEESESHSEKSPLVSSWSLAKLLLGKSSSAHENVKEGSPTR
jgi:hypothetical protein